MTRRSIGRAIWISSAIAIAVATLTPSGDTSGTVNIFCLFCGDYGGVDALLNTLLFLPVGVGLAVAGVRVTRAIPAMCIATVLIESLQLVAIPGRDASARDVLTNALGGVIGYLIGARIDRLIRPSPRGASQLVAGWLCLWLLVQTVGGYALRPQPTSSLYFGQIVHLLGRTPAYRGRVLAATLDGARIPDGAFDDSRWARETLERSAGAQVDLTVVPQGHTSQRTEIVRIVDRQKRGILLVDADRSDLVVGLRTGAGVLHLRPILVAVHDVLGDDDTVRVRASFGRQQLVVATAGRQFNRVATVRLTTGMVWHAIAPFTVYADGSAWQSVLDACWFLMCLVPAGFWAAASDRPFRGRRSWTGIAVIGLTLGAGFALGPALFGVAPSPLGEVLGAIAGVVVGGAMGAAVNRHNTTPA